MLNWKRATILATLGISAQVQAQDSFPMVDWGPTIQTEAMNSVIEDIGRSEAKRAGLPYPGDRKAEKRARPLRSTLSEGLLAQVRGRPAPAGAVNARYTPSPATRQNLANIMGGAAAKQDPAKGEEMRRLVLSGQAVAEYQRIAPMLGFRANDAVDAYAFYLLAQWGVANDYRADITRTQAAAVRRQAASAYAGIASQLDTDALRQEFAELLVIQGAILSGAHEAAVRTRDNAAVARYAALARRGGQKVFATDPAGIILTDAGFRPKA